jgi:predicted transcriptional regulator
MEQSNGRRRPYRNRMEIAAGILEIAKNCSRKTRIMYLGNLSFDLLQKYLDLLVNLGLLQTKPNEKEKIYVATEKGRQFLEDFSELQKHSEVVEAKKRSLEKSLKVSQ